MQLMVESLFPSIARCYRFVAPVTTFGYNLVCVQICVILRFVGSKKENKKTRSRKATDSRKQSELAETVLTCITVAC